MADDTESTPLDEAIAAYLKEEESGGRPDREEWIRRYPQLAGELRDFFEDHEGFQSLAGGDDRSDAQRTAHIDLMKKPFRPDGMGKGPSLRGKAPEVEAKRFGDYELGDEIARGAMGVVYRARQISLDRPVALKMMLETSFAEPEDVRRFRLEARAAGRLEHPHIVPIYDVGECNGRQYYTMRWISGGDLDDAMAQLGQDPRRMARLLATIARAVDHAHQHGILHRDLKPANILLDAEGAPHVADFGLAKRMDDPSALTLTGRVMGTAAYMSPEQASGNTKRVTAASDVYSLGAIFYEMLTGEPPFTGDNAMEVLLRVREEEPVHPVLRNPGADRGLATICMKCLEKKPDLRYATAKSLAEDLDAWLEKRPILARPPSVVRRLSGWAGRHPVAIVAATMALILPATAIIAVRWQQKSSAAQGSLVTESRDFLLRKSRTVDLALALMGKGRHAMARQLFEEVIQDSTDPMDVMDAEDGLRKLAELEKSAERSR